MKLPFFFTLYMVAISALGQYHITYKLEYYAPNSKDKINVWPGTDPLYQEYYIMDGAYKSIFDGGETWISIYNGKKNELLYLSRDEENHTADAGKREQNLIKLIELDSTIEILGNQCRAIKAIYSDYSTTYYYNDRFVVEPESFRGHQIYGWNEVIKATNGAIPLKFISEFEEYTLVGICDKIEPMTLEFRDFNLERTVREIKAKNNDELEKIIDRFSSNFKNAEVKIEDISSSTIYGKTQFGQAEFPMVYIVAKPHFYRFSSYIGGNVYVDGIYDSVSWSYDPTTKKVTKIYDEFEPELFDLFTEYKNLINYKQKGYLVLDVREFEDYYRVIVYKDNETTGFHFRKEDYLISAIQQNNEEQLYDEFRVFSGIPIATKLVSKSNNGEFIMIQDSIFFNLNYDQSFFQIPDSLKSLSTLTPKVLSASEYFEEAEKMMQENKYREAIDKYNQAIKQDSYNRIYYNKLGLAHLYGGNIYNAISAFSKAVEIDPNYATAFYNLGYSKMNLGDVRAAIKDYSKAIELNENNPLYFNYRGIAYYKLPELDSAISDFRQVIKLDSSHTMAYWNLANSLYRTEKYELAIDAFSKARDFGYEEDELLNLRGICHYKLEQFELARDDFEQIADGDSVKLNYLANLGDTYSKLELFDKSIELYERALALDSSYNAAYNALGLIYLKQESLDAAIDNFSKAIDKDDSKPEYFDNRALAKFQKMDFLGAIEDFTSSILLYPEDGYIYFMRGKAKLNVNDKFDACKDFQKAAQLGIEDAKEELENNCN